MTQPPYGPGNTPPGFQPIEAATPRQAEFQQQSTNAGLFAALWLTAGVIVPLVLCGLGAFFAFGTDSGTEQYAIALPLAVLGTGFQCFCVVMFARSFGRAWKARK